MPKTKLGCEAMPMPMFNFWLLGCQVVTMLVRRASRGATFDFWAEGCLVGTLGGFGINLETDQPRGGVLEGIDE